MPPSVTKIVGATIDKSAPLMGWAVNQALDTVKQSIDPNVSIGEAMFEVILAEARGAHRRRKQDAANFGTEVHTALERSFKSNDYTECSVAAAERVSAATAWLLQLGVESVAVERRIFSRKHRFVGTLDKLARIDGKLTLLDWKTSKGIWPEYRFQTAGYVGAYEEETGERIAQRCLVRLREDGTLEPHWFNRTSFHKDYAGFLGLLRGYKRLQEIKGEGN